MKDLNEKYVFFGVEDCTCARDFPLLYVCMYVIVKAIIDVLWFVRSDEVSLVCLCCDAFELLHWVSIHHWQFQTVSRHCSLFVNAHTAGNRGYVCFVSTLSKHTSTFGAFGALWWALKMDSMIKFLWIKFFSKLKRLFVCQNCLYFWTWIKGNVFYKI